MQKISNFAFVLLTFAMAIYLCSCASSGGGVDIKNDPIKPSPELKEGTVDPATNAITITKEGITVTVEHWSRARLDRKFTNATQRSPFFYLETWSQSMQSEVFHVRIKNDTPRGVIVDFKETKFYDDRKYEYFVVGLEELQFKFVSRHYMDLKTKNGLELAKQILLSEVLGPSGLIPAGQSAEGFLPFYTPSSQAEKVWLILVLEKEPEVATAAYQRVEFRFDFRQDITLRKTQPPTKR